VLWLQIFHTRKVIASSLWNYYSEEGLSTAPGSFLLSVALFLSLLFPYKKVRNLWKRCRSSVMASDCITQKQLLTHVNIIMKHAPIYNRHDVFAHVLLYTLSFKIKCLNKYVDFRCYWIVICDNIAAFLCVSVIVNKCL